MFITCKRAKSSSKIQTRLHEEVSVCVTDAEYYLMRILKDPFSPERYLYQAELYRITNRLLELKRYLSDPRDIFRCFQNRILSSLSDRFDYLACELMVEDIGGGVNWYNRECFTQESYLDVYNAYHLWLCNDCSQYRHLFQLSFDNEVDNIFDSLFV